MGDEVLKQLMTLLAGSSWIAFSGFGAFLAYKLAMTSVISYSAIKILSKGMDAWSQRNLSEQRFMFLIAASGMKYPLTDKEWDILQDRVKESK